MKDQPRRSSLSVILNIAEGSAKTSRKDLNRYLENSLGSISETVASMEVSSDESLINEIEFSDLAKRYEDLKNKVGSLSKKLKSEN